MGLCIRNEFCIIHVAAITAANKGMIPGRKEEKNMKKVLLLMMSLCLLCCAAFAEETLELNWEEIANDEVASAGEFQQITIPDQPTVYFWIPSVMSSVDVSVIEGPFQPTALYATEDQSNSVVVFVQQITSLEEYLGMLEKEGGASDFRNLTINGVDCVSYGVESANLETLIYPVTENIIISFNFSPMNGDEGWDAVKGVIVSSVQVAAAE